MGNVTLRTGGNSQLMAIRRGPGPEKKNGTIHPMVEVEALVSEAFSCVLGRRWMS